MIWAESVGAEAFCNSMGSSPWPAISLVCLHVRAASTQMSKMSTRGRRAELQVYVRWFSPPPSINPYLAPPWESHRDRRKTRMVNVV